MAATAASPVDKAAFLDDFGARLVVRECPMPTPRPTEVLIRNRAVAVNPADWKIQDHDDQLRLVPEYPWVLGFDMAGEVVGVGSEVTRFRVGDRVCGFADGIAQGRKENCCFRLHSCTNQKIVSLIPDEVSFADASVLPICLATAACGLFEKDKLALDHPTPYPTPTNGKWLFIYAGSTSVGACAIMLAKAAGYRIATTSSPKNFNFVKSIGATEVFDHYSPSVVEDVVRSLQGKEFEGVYESFGVQDSVEKCGKIAQQLAGKKLLTTVLPQVNDDWVPKDVKFSKIHCLTIIENEVSEVIYEGFIPRALENGVLQCRPDPLIVGSGLESCQLACDTLKAGVSFKKVVVELP